MKDPEFRVRRARPEEAAVLSRFRWLMARELTRAEGRKIPPGSADHLPILTRWIREKMREGELAGFLAVDPEGKPIGGGFVWLQEVAPRADVPGRYVPRLQAMYTRPEWRRRGVGTAVVRASLKWAQARGFERVRLQASKFARPMYEAEGFVPVAEMQRDLGPVQRSRT